MQIGIGISVTISELLLAAGLVYILGVATPVGLLRLLDKDDETAGCLTGLLLLLGIAFVGLLARLASMSW